MNITEIDRNIHLIDLEIAGIEKSTASYVLTGNNTAIIETGPASTVHNLLSGLDKMNVQPEEVTYVILSHIHLDHAGAAGKLLEYLPVAELIVHPRGAPHLVDPEKLWSQSKEVLGNIADMYGKPTPVPKHRIIPAKEGTRITIGNGIQLNILETLGHASHHLSYFEIKSQGVFVGDAAGVYLQKEDVVVPTTPSPFRLDIALSALHKVAELKPTSLYYSHFGKAYNAIDRLQAYEKQLKIWAKTAKEGIENSEDIQTISKRILERDRALQKAAEYIKSHPIWSRTILHESVKGIKQFMEMHPVFLE